jgi:hypothetical protein
MTTHRKRIPSFSPLLTCLTLLVLLTPAAAQNPSDFLQANPKPPALRLVILIDDSSTNLANASTNTLNAYNKGARLNRAPTDPNDYRGQAAIELLTRLNADHSTVHQVAVLRFAFNSSNTRWLSGNGEDRPFTEIGGGSSGLITLSNAIRGRGLRLQNDVIIGPGQLDDAARSAQNALASAYQQDTANNLFKPVVLLIADDVPIQDRLANSPFENVTRWQADLPSFESPMREMVQPSSGVPPYRGVCQSTESGGATAVFFAMGAANWVDADGTTASYDDVQNSPQTEYFVDFAQRLGSLDPQNQTPLAYRIDPQFVSTNTLATDLSNAVGEVYRALRCGTPIEIAQSEQLSGSVRYTFQLSAFYQQAQISVITPSGRTVSLTAPSDASVPTPEIISYGDVSQRIYTLTRRLDTPSAEWSDGLWTIEVGTSGGDTGGVSLKGSADLNIERSGLGNISLAGSTSGLPPSTDTELRVGILQHGIHIRSTDPLLQSTNAIQASLLNTNGREEAIERVLERTGGNGYDLIIEGEQVPDGGIYTIRMSANLKGTVGTLLPNNLSLKPVDSVGVQLEYELGFAISRSDPDQNILWECVDGKQRLVIYTTQSSLSSNAESIGSYTRVEVYYPIANLNTDPTPTPFAVLAWDIETGVGSNTAFSTQIDCGLLTPQPQANARMLVVAQFPSINTTPPSLEIAFQATPFTMTPLPTYTPVTYVPPPPTPNTHSTRPRRTA